jgi:prepilin-type N-terminal cleavage/methylation domain-containing protein/prepilin-type processing-associated H-X9-DG protein
VTTGRASRRGFTLVELLVVIAIIGILVALLLPAIQAAREAARRSQCTNNLKQMGLAIHGYHDTYKAFPIGVAGDRTKAAFAEEGLGWGVGLLPFMEEQTLFDRMKPTYEPAICRKTYAATGMIYPGADTILEVFRCPTSELPTRTADLPPELTGYASNDYKGCNGSDASGLDKHGIFNTVQELWKLNGRTKLAFKDVTDGLNKTLAVGESAYYKEDEKWPVWIGATTEDEQALFETNKKNPINCELSPKSIDYFRKATEDSCAFSFHTGGAYFLFADGSVHFLEESIDVVAYENLGNIADGNVVSDFR